MIYELDKSHPYYMESVPFTHDFLLARYHLCTFSDAFSQITSLTVVRQKMRSLGFIVLVFMHLCVHTYNQNAVFQDSNSFVTDGRTDEQTHPLIEMRERI